MTQAAILASNASLMTTPSGTAPTYQCRAWVNFNGTGTVAIRASGNVSSITDNGVGDYTVNFTSAMSDVNYSCTQMGVTASGVGADARENQVVPTKTTTAYRIAVINFVTSNYADISSVNVAIFR